MTDKIKVSVIIVNYNSGIHLEETIKSLYEWTKDISFELILVDNCSAKTDESVIFIDNEIPKYKNVKTIMSQENNGFGKANNIGFEQSQGKYILFLNPDVTLQNNALKILVDYLDQHQDVAFVGPKVLNVDGTFQSSCMRGEPKPKAVFLYLSKCKILKKHPEYFTFSMENADINQIQEVVGLSGCFMMAPKTVLDEIGGFDEQFFLYQEETDLCYRAFQKGWKLIYNPDAEVIHKKGVTTRKMLAKNTYIFCQSMMKFFKKYYWQNYNVFQKGFWTVLIWGNFILKYSKAKLVRNE